MSQTLDFDSYREATAPDQVKIGGVSYPLKPVGFNRMVDFAAELERMDISQPHQVRELAGRFSDISGVPAEVVDELTLGEMMELFRFFAVRQLPGQSSPESLADAEPEGDPPTPKSI